MKKHLLTWISPFLLALLLIVLIRAFFIDVVSSSESKNYFVKSNLKNRNQLVLYKNKLDSDSCLVLRKIALPGDTLRIKKGLLYVNGEECVDGNSVSSYTYTADSLNEVVDYLFGQAIEYNVATAYIGSFDMKATKEQLDTLKTVHNIYDIKRTYLNTELSEKSILGNELYWNKDNIGPLIVPQKGMRMRISNRFYVIYKDIIQNETGKKLRLKNGKPYLNGKLLEIYSFKNNYCFLLNDDRTNLNDSRTFGFVAEKKIKGKYLMSL